MFFEAQPLAPQELPDGVMGDRDAVIGQQRLRPAHTQMQGGRDRLEHENQVGVQNEPAACVHARRSDRAGCSVALVPLYHRRHRDIEARGNLAHRFARKHRGHDPFAKIIGIGFGHACRPPPSRQFDDVDAPTTTVGGK